MPSRPLGRRPRSHASALAVALLALAVALAGCGAASTTAGPPSASPPGTARPSEAASGPATIEPSPAATGPGAASSSATLASPVTGVVVSVESAGLAKVSGFTLRLPDGTQQAFRIGILENGAEFPPGHLKEHALTAAPVRVFFRSAGSDLVVYRIEDAG